MKMSVVIIGGNERMERQYSDICSSMGCRAKVYTKESSMKKKVGSPDIMIVFTGTVSHKMLLCATQEAKRSGTKIAHVHSSSATALTAALKAELENRKVVA